MLRSNGDRSECSGTYPKIVPTFDVLEPRVLLSGSVALVEVDNSSALSGYHTYDLQVTTDSDWMSAALLLELTSGTIYQHELGSNTAPNQAVVDVVPALGFDTSVGGDVSNVSVAGGAGDLGGGALQFDDSVLSISWFNASAGDTGTFAIARITLSDDAVGTWSYYTFSGDATGSGTIESGVLQITAPGPGPDPDVLNVAGDFDYDGDVDIVWRNGNTGETVIWSMDDETFESSSALANATADTDWVTVGVGDFTGDGKTDTLWRNTADGRIYIEQTEDGVGGVHHDLTTVSDLRWQVAAVADMTGDGQLDIVWRHATTGQNVVWEMNGTSYQQKHSLKRVKSTDWQIVGAGDFNADGETDLLWRNMQNGRNLVWYMQGTQYDSNQQIKRVKDQNWQMAQVADFTGDGKTDILWRNTSTGQNVIWQMNSSSYQSVHWLPSQASQDWQIAGSMLGLWEA